MSMMGFLRSSLLYFRAPALLCLLACTLPACHHSRDLTTSTTKPTAEQKRLQTKYAALLAVPENEITNFNLYTFIDEWYSAPYLYGGKTKSGIDCSGLVAALYRNVYKKELVGTSASLYDNCEKRATEKLEEGDLVFFKINGSKISHVGVYLKNRHFVHASTKKGVIISSLDEAYYKSYFAGGGKPKF